MNDERKYEILDRLIDAMNAGDEGVINELLSSDEEELSEVLPLFDFATWLKVATVNSPEIDKTRIKEAVLQKVTSQADWSMHRLIASSKSTTVSKATQAGLTQHQIEQLSDDGTPIDLDEPKGTVQHLAEQYGVKFNNLLGWVRQLITDVLSSQPQSSMSPAFTREKNQQEDESNKADGDH